MCRAERLAENRTHEHSATAPRTTMAFFTSPRTLFRCLPHGGSTIIGIGYMNTPGGTALSLALGPALITSEPPIPFHAASASVTSHEEAATVRPRRPGQADKLAGGTNIFRGQTTDKPGYTRRSAAQGMSAPVVRQKRLFARRATAHKYADRSTVVNRTGSACDRSSDNARRPAVRRNAKLPAWSPANASVRFILCVNESPARRSAEWLLDSRMRDVGLRGHRSHTMRPHLVRASVAESIGL
jgi:hypothetical protein